MEDVEDDRSLNEAVRPPKDAQPRLQPKGDVEDDLVHSKEDAEDKRPSKIDLKEYMEDEQLEPKNKQLGKVDVEDEKLHSKQDNRLVIKLNREDEPRRPGDEHVEYEQTQLKENVQGKSPPNLNVEYSVPLEGDSDDSSSKENVEDDWQSKEDVDDEQPQQKHNLEDKQLPKEDSKDESQQNENVEDKQPPKEDAENMQLPNQHFKDEQSQPKETFQDKQSPQVDVEDERPQPNENVEERPQLYKYVQHKQPQKVYVEDNQLQQEDVEVDWTQPKENVEYERLQPKEIVEDERPQPKENVEDEWPQRKENMEDKRPQPKENVKDEQPQPKEIAEGERPQPEEIVEDKRPRPKENVEDVRTQPKKNEEDKQPLQVDVEDDNLPKEHVEDERPSLPCDVLQQITEEVGRVVSEGIENAVPTACHCRARSEMVPPGHFRSNSFSKWKESMQRAMQRGSRIDQHDLRFSSSFNPEILANQKRQWYKLHSQRPDLTKYKVPMSLFEHFVIVGLHSDSNLEAVEDAFAKRKTWELQRLKSDRFDFKKFNDRGPSFPILEPQILFKYPPGKKLAMRPQDLPAFCFPEGVKARLMERTPSLSDLNKVVYGQEHLGRDDLSFIFSLKGSDNATLYGVCLHVQEIVQRSPGIVGAASPIPRSFGCCSRFLFSAPRCYCVLTRVPFFELHYEMLNCIIVQERLNRITQFVSEMTLTDYVPSHFGMQEQMNKNIESPNTECSADWTASAIPVDSAAALAAASAGIISDTEVQSLSSRLCESQSPDKVSASEASDYSQAKELDMENRGGIQYFSDYASETSETRSDGVDKMYGCYANDHISPEIGMLCSSQCLNLERNESSESLSSSVRSLGSEDEIDEVDSMYDKNMGSTVLMSWAKEHRHYLLQIVCGYHTLPLPSYGSELYFLPLEHLQPIKYSRPSVSALGICGNLPDFNKRGSLEPAEVNARLAAAEEALSLSIWTIATVCRALSLDSILAFFAGVLLEKQVIVVCQNLGVLSATILSLIPMIRPFEWQSLLLPVLPRQMLDFLDAPVPFVAGIQHKPGDLKIKTSNLIYVDVDKDKVKVCYMPCLPRYKELISELAPIHARLSCERSIARRNPVVKCNDIQAEAAAQFLGVMRCYLESFCKDLRSHTITSVESNNDKVSLLFKDSFIDSFPTRDRPFIKLFVDTQLFSVLSDSRISCYENE